MKFFCFDLEAVKVAEICNISEKTIDKIFKAIRIKMAENCEKQTKLSGEIEIDESYFGVKRVRGKRSRGASGKTPVFGLLKRNGKVHTR